MKIEPNGYYTEVSQKIINCIKLLDTILEKFHPFNEKNKEELAKLQIQINDIYEAGKNFVQKTNLHPDERIKYIITIDNICKKLRENIALNKDEEWRDMFHGNIFDNTFTLLTNIQNYATGQAVDFTLWKLKKLYNEKHGISENIISKQLTKPVEKNDPISKFIKKVFGNDNNENNTDIEDSKNDKVLAYILNAPDLKQKWDNAKDTKTKQKIRDEATLRMWESGLSY